MTAAYGLALAGSDHRTSALADRLTQGSPHAYGRFSLEAGTQLAPSKWAVLAADPAVHAVYLGGDPADKAAAASALLSAGKAVLTTLPLATSTDGLAALERASGQAALIVTTDLRHTMAGNQALRAVESGELGRLHSVFLATRMRGGAPQAEATERLWEAIDFVQALAAGSRPVRAHAMRGGIPLGSAVQGNAILLINLRFEGDIIATIDVSAGLAADSMLPDPETEIEICGTQGALRVEPYRHTVEVSGRAPRSWHAHPAISMLEQLGAVLDSAGGRGGSDSLVQHRRVMAIVDAVVASLESGRATAP